jgi:hypothetical protein
MMRSTAVPSWAKLVHTSAGAVDGVEGLAEVVRDGFGGGDGVLSGLDLNGAAVACARLAAFCEGGLFRPRYGVITGSPAPM